MAESADALLQGCGLPVAWRGQPRWCVLETSFGAGLNFLATWDAWRRDPARPRVLHFVAIAAGPVNFDHVQHPLATQLAAQLWGLQPGVHRLVFEGGQVLLTLCIGDAQVMLRERPCQADSVYLDGTNTEQWSPHTLKAVARCCRLGTRIATEATTQAVHDALAQVGFKVQKTHDLLKGEYAPAWTPRGDVSEPAYWTGEPGDCIVIGAGIAGASAAASLARRGWRVLVLDAADRPATGASALPAGLFAPHVSGDDNLVSRITRAGVRATRELARGLLREDVDWGPTGVLQHQAEGSVKKLPHDDAASRDWSRPASHAQRTQAGLPSDLPSEACHWHASAGWLRPAALVRALLATPGVQWCGGVRVERLQRTADGAAWQLLDATGNNILQAPLVVLATAYGTRALTHGLLPAALPLNPLRGQVAYGSMSEAPPELEATRPPFPVNGLGSFISGVPGPDEAQAIWITGATYERACDQALIRPEDHTANWAKLQILLPQVAAALQPAFEEGAVTAWAGVRCTYPDRLPLVGPLDAQHAPGLWVSTAMGSRGLTLAVLCAELLAARLHGEPLPLPAKLAAALDARRAQAKG
ncbi:FAD-dependent 5-carboxymethylaminomethyl-2-thiouridine(34) oxidoreductase MnmC [Variovorax sp. HJSM1_2]|uniref:FAD-dependent 5-carboxymethylaminomethyl-2-thiouridine(34) oxidoreductase MnmC n=1 Tax=Variovorax sp. HJSM1_2 TaxID=3366263 RepID=UPI003BE45EE2